MRCEPRADPERFRERAFGRDDLRHRIDRAPSLVELLIRVARVDHLRAVLAHERRSPYENRHRCRRSARRCRLYSAWTADPVSATEASGPDVVSCEFCSRNSSS